MVQNRGTVAELNLSGEFTGFEMKNQFQTRTFIFLSKINRILFLYKPIKKIIDKQHHTPKEVVSWLAVRVHFYKKRIEFALRLSFHKTKIQKNKL